MSRMTTVGRRGIVAAFAATIITTAACGTDTGTTEVEDYVPYAPGAVAPPSDPHAPTSADSAERRGAAESTPVTPAEKQPGPHGMRVPD